MVEKMTRKKAWQRPDSPIVFQFTHPGKEHDKYEEIGRKNVFLKPWNTQTVGKTTSHRRKYLCTAGQYIAENGLCMESKLDFWGEWEADSVVVEFSKEENNNNLPKCYHIPFYLPLENRNSYEKEIDKRIYELYNEQRNTVGENCYYQNTDPFVFGEGFMYATICKPYQTLNIKPGSIIMFGSTHKYGNESKYRVDTVFVVREIKDIKTDENGDFLFDEYKSGENIYYNTTLKYLDSNDGFDHKLFIGATPQNDVNGMYSFIPARCSNGKRSRERVETMIIEDKFNKLKCIKNTVNWQGYIVCSGEKTVKEFWDELLKYTYKKGYVPAVKINMPTVLTSINELGLWINNIDTDE